MNSDFDRNRSLEELEGADWGEAMFPSHLVTECHRLRRLPLKDFTPEYLRIMISQDLCLPYLVPLALECLKHDPLVSGDHAEGDLLATVLSVKKDFWSKHPGYHQQVKDIIGEHCDAILDCDWRTPSEWKVLLDMLWHTA